MSLLGRFFGSRDDVPEWACFFDPPSYKTFLSGVEDEMKRRGTRFELGDGTVRLHVPGEEPSEYGLLNLAQVCHASPRREWPETITEHFDRALKCGAESQSLDARAERLDAVRDSIKVRLYHEEYLSQIGPEKLVYRKPAPGLVETLVYDLPGSVRTVPPDHPLRWDEPLDRLFAIGLENIKAEGRPEIQSFDIDKGTKFFAIVGDSFFTSSHALLLDNYLDPRPEHGALVAIPHRHAVLYHPIVDLRILQAINSMIPVTFGMYQEGPGSVSPNLYWWRDGALSHLPTKVTSQSVTFSPPDAFIEEVLNRLTE